MTKRNDYRTRFKKMSTAELQDEISRLKGLAFETGGTSNVAKISYAERLLKKKFSETSRQAMNVLDNFFSSLN